ncbi:hypothetical protein IFR05_011169 [Cadophora sp. M221]|nr:hypothetical protein IFR05_011169 [Cadophora sp. M221]
MHHRRMHYSTITAPIFTRRLSLRKNHVILSLGPSSKKLVRWLCAVLASGAGWFAQGSVPPWTAHCNEDIQFIISTELSTNDVVQEKPPSFVEAIDLVLELCTLYDIGSQPTVAFLTVLLFPFHAIQDLQPRLTQPQIPPPTEASHEAPVHIRDLANDIRYYMTLSFSDPYPKLAPLWLGFFRCGSNQVLEMIKRYLTTHHEHPGWSLGHPYLGFAAWTGLKQSFLHEECSHIYNGHGTLVNTADVLRHRFNFRLADTGPPCFGWQPFGTMRIDQIEPELWPRLRSPSPSRKYKHWVWWLDKIKVNECYVNKTEIEKGFSHDKRVSNQDVVESTIESHSLENVINDNDIAQTTPKTPRSPSPGRAIPIESFKQGPSKVATLHVLRMGSWEVSGDRTLDSIGIPELRNHDWL